MQIVLYAENNYLGVFDSETNNPILSTVFPPLKPKGLIFFYFRISSFINKQGLIRIITIFANSCAISCARVWES